MWFLGQVECYYDGQLWAPAEGSRLLAPGYLCTLACGSEWRVLGACRCSSMLPQSPLISLDLPQPPSMCVHRR